MNHYDGLRTTRVSKGRVEYLLEIVLLKTLDAENNVSQMLRMYPPRLMPGRSGWHVFGSSLECVVLPRDGLEANIKIEIALMDGLHIGGHLKKRSAWKIQQDELVAELAAGEDNVDGSHMTWNLGMRCILHVFQSGVKWSVAPLVREQLAKDVHNLIRTLRNSSGAIYDEVDTFLLTRVCYDGADANLDVLHDFWVRLGVTDPTRLRQILEVNPRWGPTVQVLRVTAKLRDEVDMGRGKIRSVM